MHWINKKINSLGFLNVTFWYGHNRSVSLLFNYAIDAILILLLKMTK